MQYTAACCSQLSTEQTFENFLSQPSIEQTFENFLSQLSGKWQAVLHCAARSCSVLQCVAVCCSVLQQGGRGNCPLKTFKNCLRLHRLLKKFSITDFSEFLRAERGRDSQISQSVHSSQKSARY